MYFVAETKEILNRGYLPIICAKLGKMAVLDSL